MLRNCVAVALCASLMMASLSLAAAPGKPDPAGQSTAPAGPRKHLANIVFAGLAGAILGLSTLSFYGRPQDRLSNIAVGFALGVIIGAGYTTYKAAVEPKEFYGLQSQVGEITEMQPELWAVEQDSHRGVRNEYTPRASIAFEF